MNNIAIENIEKREQEIILQKEKRKERISFLNKCFDTGVCPDCGKILSSKEAYGGFYPLDAHIAGGRKIIKCKDCRNKYKLTAYGNPYCIKRKKNRQLKSELGKLSIIKHLGGELCKEET